jgi:hypothetical protein
VNYSLANGLVKFKDPAHPQLMKYQNDIQYAVNQAGIPACLLAAIVWRESRGQNVYQLVRLRLGCRKWLLHWHFVE